MKMKDRLRSLMLATTIVCTSVLGGSLVGCDKADDNIDTKVSEQAATAIAGIPADAPTYEVAMVTSFEPYSFRGEDNEIVGFNVDLLNAIAEREQFHIHYIQTPWDGDFKMLSSEQHDMMGSLVVVTPERQKFLDFSATYMTSGYAAGVKSDFKDVTPEQLFADKNLTYSVLPNSVLERELLAFGVPKQNVIPTETEFLGVRNVLSGTTDAVFTETNVLRYYAGTYEGIKIIPVNDTAFKMQFPVKKGNTELLDKINSGLISVKNDGTYDEIYKKWFGGA